jgi:nucleoside-diphosphate-sugar epimerase
MARLLVTGDAGFIGSNFVHHVIEHTDHHVTCWTSSPTPVTARRCLACPNNG